MAPEVKHHAGGSLSVYADEHGKPRCGTCGEPVTQDEIFALLRMPAESSFIPLCRDCTRRLAKLAMDGMADDEHALGILLI